jgi:hypothetical protein
MTPALFLYLIEHGLPGSSVTNFRPAQLSARVEYGGQFFEVSGGECDGFPLWLVTHPDGTLSRVTNSVIERLDSISEETSVNSRTWELWESPSLMARLRELAKEDGDDEPTDIV